MKKAFTLLELVIVMVVIGIITSAVSFRDIFSYDAQKIYLGRDFVISLIKETENKALNNDNYKLYYNSSDANDKLMSKYYFKNFYHVKIFNDTDGNVKMYVFRDSPNSGFDNDIVNYYDTECVKNGAGLFYSGKYDESGYPAKSDTDITLNLGKKFGITDVTDQNGKHEVNLLFDRMGNIYLSEGLTGADAGDIYIYDKTYRPVISTDYSFKLTDKYGQCVQIKINKYGIITKENCS